MPLARSKSTAHPTSRAMLERAAELFAERGYDAVSVREIVDAVGVSKPVLYYHWKSKEGVARAIIEDFFLQAHALRDDAFHQNQKLQGVLHYYAKGMLELAHSRRATLAFGLSMRFGRISLRGMFDEMRKQDACVMGEWCGLLAERGLEPQVAARLARTFWSLLFSELIAVLDCPRDLGTEASRADEIIEIVFHGALKEPSRRTAP